MKAYKENQRCAEVDAEEYDKEFVFTTAE